MVLSSFSNLRPSRRQTVCSILSKAPARLISLLTARIRARKCSLWDFPSLLQQLASEPCGAEHLERRQVSPRVQVAHYLRYVAMTSFFSR